MILLSAIGGIQRNEMDTQMNTKEIKLISEERCMIVPLGLVERTSRLSSFQKADIRSQNSISKGADA